MPKIEIYTGNRCGFCDRAKSLFDSKNLKYIEYNVNDNIEYLNAMLLKSNGQKTIPQIFINDVHIGGYDQLIEMIQTDKFNSILDS